MFEGARSLTALVYASNSLLSGNLQGNALGFSSKKLADISLSWIGPCRQLSTELSPHLFFAFPWLLISCYLYPRYSMQMELAAAHVSASWSPLSLLTNEKPHELRLTELIHGDSYDRLEFESTRSL